MRHVFFFGLAALTAAAGLGCGSSHSGGDGGGGATPIEDVPARLAETFCSQFEECAGSAVTDLFFPAGCVSQLQATFEDSELPRWEAAIDAGTVEYDGTKVDGCISEIGALGCDLFTERAFDACEDALGGTVEPGGTCNASVECAGARICRFPDASCPGTCGERKSDGAECEEDDECQSGLTCQSGACTAPAEAGEECGGGTAPECVIGTLCVGEDAEAGTPGTCMPAGDVLVAAEGEECNLDDGPFCEEGLSCAVTDFGSGGIVAECVGPVGSGGTCNVGFPDPCPDDEYCDADIMAGDFEGTCTPLPTDGEPCVDGALFRACAAGHVCSEGTCAQIGRIGDPCDADEQCYSANCDGGSCAEAPLCGAS